MEKAMYLHIETEQEVDGRWIAAVSELPGTLVYGKTQEEAVRQVKALALRVIADRLENGEPVPAAADVFEVAA
jgi:predicted RNase H-like HicB family nuclease